VTIVGVGLDLVQIARVQSIAERWHDRFLNRVYTERERDECLARVSPYASLAGRFAVKEAVLKALGTGWSGGISWRDIEITRTSDGRPVAATSGRVRELMQAAGVRDIHISLSHDAEYAVGQAILTGQP